MFAGLANFTAKYRFLILAVWIVAAVFFVIFAPSLSAVGVTDDAQFLPQNTESTQAEALLKDRFTGAAAEPAGSAVIVVFDPQGLSVSDNQTARDLRDWLLSRAAPSVITAVNSPFDNAALNASLVSQDRTTLLIVLKLAQSSASTPSRQAVDAIRAHIAGLPDAPRIYITGGAGVSTDVLASIQKTINNATLVTVILVVILLLLIYRSPVAICVPLLTIGVAYLVARGITGYIAGAGFQVSSLVDAYMVVTLFGIGTDYCLFIVSRFKEELSGGDRRQAGQKALRQIGPVILASATMVIVALLCLGISRFGMNRTSGLMLALGVAVTLLAGLTLTPALISIFGSRLLWPARLQSGARVGGLWARIGALITRRPLAFVLPLLIVLALPYLAFPRINYTASLLSQMPEDIGSVQGYHITLAHFPPGAFNPVTVVVAADRDRLAAPAGIQSLGAISTALAQVSGVAAVTYCASPVTELGEWSQQTDAVLANLNLTTLGQISFFHQLEQNLTALVVRYPGLPQSTNFQQISTALRQVQAAVDGLTPANAQSALTQIRQAVAGISPGLAALASEFNLAVDSAFTRWLQAVYFSTDGQLARIDVTLDTDPYSAASIAAVGRIRQTTGEALRAASLTGTYFVGGTSADQSDILAVNGSDFLRVLGLAIIGILLVTIILLRSLLAPLYMITTVLFNFGATLGIATWLFLDVLHHQSLIYMLPIFVFVILVAVGSDYNIFLVSRLREECRQKSLPEAVRHAVANTGGVITSCGIILAGTFATLTTASLQMVLQVGGAIAIGVLIDTFLVRALLIPSLATLAGRWNWWPSRK
jgi:putative drug exporter of the RND superfamily